MTQLKGVGKPLNTAPRGVLSDPLRAAIADRRLSATQVAEAAGVDRRMVSRWLKGERDVLAATLDRIAYSLGFEAVESARRAAKAKAGAKAVKPAPEVIA